MKLHKLLIGLAMFAGLVIPSPAKDKTNPVVTIEVVDAQTTVLFCSSARSARDRSVLTPGACAEDPNSGKETREMKAIRIHQYGGPEVVKVEDVPQPS